MNSFFKSYQFLLHIFKCSLRTDMHSCKIDPFTILMTVTTEVEDFLLQFKCFPLKLMLKFSCHFNGVQMCKPLGGHQMSSWGYVPQDDINGFMRRGKQMSVISQVCSVSPCDYLCHIMTEREGRFPDLSGCRIFNFPACRTMSKANFNPF